jgi:twitching motility two-component system response regulator PilG
MTVNSNQQEGIRDRVLPNVTLDSSKVVPAHQAAADAAPTLKLYVRGLEQDERQLLDGLVRVSQRRSPRLAVLDEQNARDADVVLIDNGNAEASAWAKNQGWLKDKAVLWIGAENIPVGHTSLHRPVQWSILPMQMARALERSPGTAAWAEASRPAPLQAVKQPASSAQAPRHVLVVDDSLAIRNYMRSLLETGGFAVSMVDSVEAALEIVKQQPFECVFMDVMMPGIDGYEGCRQIKARMRGARALPVIMLTSKSSPFDRIRGKMAGCDAYLTKPVDPKQLGEVLAQQLKVAQDRAALTVSTRSFPSADSNSAKPSGMPMRLS